MYAYLKYLGIRGNFRSRLARANDAQPVLAVRYLLTQSVNVG